MKIKYNRSYFEDREGDYAGYRYEQIYPRMRTIAKSLTEICNPTRVLDVGCAKGFLVKAFLDEGVEAVGIDISEYAIKNRAINDLFFMDAENLGFKANTFDLVTCLKMIEHLDNPEIFIKEISSILKTEGYLFITTPTPKGDQRRRNHDPTHKSVMPQERWMNIFDGYERVHKDEVKIRNAVANYYANKSPSSSFGMLLNYIGMRRIAIHLEERFVQPKFELFFQLRKGRSM